MKSETTPVGRTQVTALGWIWNVLVAIDEVGNALAGGDPHHTVSARVGCFADPQNKSKPRYRFWRSLERFIDWTFRPKDGADHCADACAAEKDYTDQEGNPRLRGVLGVLVVVACFCVLAPAIRLYALFNPAWGERTRQSLSYAEWYKARHRMHAAAMLPPRETSPKAS